MADERFVLPTGKIIHTFNTFEPVFCFYEEGVRGLVRDTVLLNTGDPEGRAYVDSDEARIKRGKLLFAEGLLERVIAQYENSLDLRYLENTLGQYCAESIVRMMVEQIDLAVAQMLRDYFGGQVYQMCKSRWKWVGTDLLIRVQFLR